MSVQRRTLKIAIDSLNSEEFIEAVSIFENEYLNNTVVLVDGSGDGGCDIKRFKNGEELQECVQVTVNKRNLKSKLLDDLRKVKRRITDYQYSTSFVFYCSKALSNTTIDEYRLYAQREHGIDLTVFDCNRLCELAGQRLQEFLYSKLPLAPNQLNGTKFSKSDFDIANQFLCNDICHNNPQFERLIYEESDLRVSDLFISPICSLNRYFDEDVVFLPVSDSVINDCLTVIQDSGLLLIKGPYGSGKTILTKVLIGELRKYGHCVCLKANDLSNDFFKIHRASINKCIEINQKLYIFIDSCELFLANSDNVNDISRLLKEYHNCIHFIINYRSIQDNEKDQILYDFRILLSPTVLRLKYFNNSSIQQWIERYNNTRIESGEPTIDYSDIQRANKNLKTSCKNPLILLMVSSNTKARAHLLRRNWYAVFHEFVKKTINGKYQSEKERNPLFKRFELEKDEYLAFLADVASSISRDSDSKKLSSQMPEDDFYLDSNEVLYSIDASKIERFVPSRIVNALESSNAKGKMSKPLLQTLNCFFFEVNESSCRFRDNNILFYFKAYNYSRALETAIARYQQNLDNLDDCLKILRTASSGMILHPVVIEFILDSIQISERERMLLLK